MNSKEKNPGALIDRLKTLYEISDGVFVRRVSRSGPNGKAGSVAGTDLNGYVAIRVDRVSYLAHRLVWLLNHGRFPAGEIDHINGQKADNRIENLREVNHRTNCENEVRARNNNKLGLLGVSLDAGKFKAQININGKKVNLGRFRSATEAHEKYLDAKRRYHDGFNL